MKTIDALTALRAINAMDGRPVPMKFSYAAARNRRKLADLAEAYDKRRKELLDQFGEKDEAGKLKTDKDNIKFLIADQEGFDAAIKSLGEEDVPLTLHKVAFADLPTTGVEIGIMEAFIVADMLTDADTGPQA